MQSVAGVAGLLLIFVILWEAFETIVLPRRVARRLRLTRLFYRSTWIPWSAVARRALGGQRREAFLGFYGPLSLLVLLTVWAAGLILGFALLQWASGSAIQGAEGMSPFSADLYLSGTTFRASRQLADDGLGTEPDARGRGVSIPDHERDTPRSRSEPSRVRRHGRKGISSGP